MSRTVVTVATGNYYKEKSLRLQEKIAEFGNCEFSPYTDPSILQLWPTHKDVPYAFKAYSLVAESTFSELLLWCDVSILPIKSLEPLWERIERDGYFLARNENGGNYIWTADSAYRDLFPGIDIEEARSVNKKIPQVIATAFGVNVQSSIGKQILDEYFRLANTKAFCGPWANSNHPTDKDRYGENSPYTTAPCGPPDVRGHRHDQTALSVIAYNLGVKLTQPPDIITGVDHLPEKTEDTILVIAG